MCLGPDIVLFDVRADLPVFSKNIPKLNCLAYPHGPLHACPTKISLVVLEKASCPHSTVPLSGKKVKKKIKKKRVVVFSY